MSLPTLDIDFAYSLSDAPGPRCASPEAFESVCGRFTEILSPVLQSVDEGIYGFWALPKDPKLLPAIEDVASKIPAACEDVVIVGIGGSSLGARALYEGLCGPAHRRLAAGGRRLHFPDNCDPWRLSALMKALRPENTLMVVISKSGSTLETAANYLVLREWMKAAIGTAELKRRLVIITDPAEGALRRLARSEGLLSLPIPANVGGRFSVLSAVGLFPAHLAGLDVSAVLEGAHAMANACEHPDLTHNPAGILACVHSLHAQSGRPTAVLMPYADALRPFGEWWSQLWAESLGKRHNRERDVVEVGSTPIMAIGTTDQHSQLQLLMEGPHDKLISFIQVQHPCTDLALPTEPGPFGHLGGHTMQGILHAARRATSIALHEAKRPNLTLTVPSLSERTLGELFFLYQATTAMVGELYNIDAFDQPGVEASKRLTHAILGKPGFESEKALIKTVEARPTRRFRYAPPCSSSPEGP